MGTFVEPALSGASIELVDDSLVDNRLSVHHNVLLRRGCRLVAGVRAKLHHPDWGGRDVGRDGRGGGGGGEGRRGVGGHDN